MTIGFLGVGHLATAMVEGLVRSGTGEPILLSPRGRAGELAARHGLEVCRDNRDLVERSDIVVLAVRPPDAASAAAGLPWRQEQVLVSVCAGVPLAGFPPIPARIVRAMPLTAARINASPTVFHPDVGAVRRLLEPLGPAIALGSEAEFEVATVNAAIYGWVQDLIRQSVVWCGDHGADGTAMRQLVAGTFVAAGRMIAESGKPMDEILRDLATPGGITELGLAELDRQGQPAAWQAACDRVLERLTSLAAGQPPHRAEPGIVE